MSQIPYSRVPVTAELIDGQLVDIGSGEVIVPPEHCECDEGHLCYRVECQEQSFLDNAEAEAEFARTPRQPSRDEWNQAYADRPSKRDAYDRTFGAEL